MIHIGFTGTRAGMTSQQSHKVTWLIKVISDDEDLVVAHHGDCKGADSEFDGRIRHRAIKRHQEGLVTRIIGHIPDNDKERCFINFDEERDPKPYLDRNHDIVDESDVMIATPKEYSEIWRGSGTWATIRYAKKQGKKLYIVYPDGKMEKFPVE